VGLRLPWQSGSRFLAQILVGNALISTVGLRRVVTVFGTDQPEDVGNALISTVGLRLDHVPLTERLAPKPQAPTF
jgi:hypothetical protein